MEGKMKLFACESLEEKYRRKKQLYLKMKKSSNPISSLVSFKIIS